MIFEKSLKSEHTSLEENAELCKFLIACVLSEISKPQSQQDWKFKGWEGGGVNYYD